MTTRLATYLLLIVASVGSAYGQSFDLVEGVAVDDSGTNVYFMRPGGGIESVAVQSGTSNWLSDDADKPLGLRDGLLISQIETAGVPTVLEIAALDIASGSLRQRASVALPSGVLGSIDESLGRSFSPEILTAAGGPLVSWRQIERYTKGIAPAPGEQLVEERVGGYHFQAQEGRLVSVPDAALAEARAAETVPLPQAPSAWVAAHPLEQAPTPTGSVFAATEVSGGMSSPTGRITLKRWDQASGGPLPDVEIHRGPHILQLRSVDSRHLLISERIAPGDFEEYEWSVFSLDDGERIGQFRHHRSHAPFFARGSTVVFVEPFYACREGARIVEHPRRVRAAVLGSGSIVWERDLRDTTYRGPAPP